MKTSNHVNLRGVPRIFAFLILALCSACSTSSPTAIVLKPTQPPSPTISAPLVEETPVQPSVEAPAAATAEVETPEPKTTDSTPVFDTTRLYISQPGDTWIVIANRLGALPTELTCTDPCPIDPASAPNTLLPRGTIVLAPTAYKSQFTDSRLIPDSEVIFSSAATNFNVDAYLQVTNGYLNHHRQYLMMSAWNSGADIITLVASENSINPRLLLALLEYQCSCVFGETEQPEPFMQAAFHNRSDLYGQLVWAVHELSEGYYGWRSGTLTQLQFPDGTQMRLNPDLNAGTVALYNLFSKLYAGEKFFEAIDQGAGFPAVFRQMFGNPWTREMVVYPDGAKQPEMDLPFEPGMTWSYTGGPHPSFEGSGPLASLDFAPASAEPGCQDTKGWVTAVAEGIVVRSEFGLVIQDLDGDGNEQTGWVIMYLHVGEANRVPVGTWLSPGERLGQPSCEGGTSNGTHLHITRKLNGEWISAGSGPMPVNFDGWIAQDGPIVYKGTLHRADEVLEACTCSWRQSWIENEE